MNDQLSLFDFGAVAHKSQRPSRTRQVAGEPHNQLPLDLGPVSLRQFEPVHSALEGASRFTHGAHSIAGLENTQADRFRGFKVQQAYRQAQRSPEMPGIRKSYEAMRQGVNRQYEFMTRPKAAGGMGLQHEVTEHDPYKTPQEMAQDVAHGRIRSMSTEATGGHAFFSNAENDRFRAVHDVFGHAAIGRGFSRHGEEAAFLSHRQMFPKAAHAALASETRGQNSYLNYRQVHSSGNFPEQSEKLIGLPAFAAGVRRK